jgi:hypothetical protein
MPKGAGPTAFSGERSKTGNAVGSPWASERGPVQRSEAKRDYPGKGRGRDRRGAHKTRSEAKRNESPGEAGILRGSPALRDGPGKGEHCSPAQSGAPLQTELSRTINAENIKNETRDI